MGLDMYLEGEFYYRGRYEDINEQVVLAKDKGTQYETKFTFDTQDIDSLIISLGYWRKANMIHKWFVDKCFDGSYDDYEGDKIEVTVEQLNELKDLCNEVIGKLITAETIEKKREVIDSKLPMQDGFFFGYYELKNDERINYYIDDLVYTIKELDKALDKIEKYGLNCIYYSASW